MSLIHRPVRAVAVAVLGLAMTAMTGALATSAMASGHPAPPAFVALSGSAPAVHESATGEHASGRMSVEVALAPRNARGLNALLAAQYAKDSGRYHAWLARGQFDARFAPSASTRAAVARYLESSGLTVRHSASPFLVRATGSSRAVAGAFRTRLMNYKTSHGKRFFANGSAVRLPSSLAGGVLGVIGLTNLVREHDFVKPGERPTAAQRPAGKPAGSSQACEEDPYPTDAQIAGLYLDGTGFPAGYGAGPGCSGLSPSQTRSIYEASDAGPAANGAGVTLAVFELSAYLKSDISTWGKTIFGPGFRVKLHNENVDGGSLTPMCPAGDTCPDELQAYAGDVEVDADIEQQLTAAPDAPKINVYSAPNDLTGETTVDEYTRIASDDSASAISSSWGACENDIGTAVAQAENIAFEQMAAQGQSMFAASGDQGAFDCLLTDGTSVVNVDDPESQPWVTSVGGTSLETDNPGQNPAPGYPAAGTETVWNVDNLCNADADENGASGFFWCSGPGASGGGSSEFWGRPAYQHAPGVNNQFTTTGCAFAASAKTPCREVPDITANADEWTPYTEFCTGNDNTPNSVCGEFSQFQPVPGWFGDGGTSLSSPLWSGIAADMDSFRGLRMGNLNPLLYTLFDLDPGRYFHDINGIGPAQQLAPNNGLFPSTPGFDEATGLGSPRMAALITGS